MDMISRQAAIDLWEKYHYTIAVDAMQYDAELRQLPSAQPEIIACADCKHWICHDRRCGYWNHGVKPLEWCSHAERREDGQTT